MRKKKGGFYLRIESSLLVATEEVLRDDVTVRDEVVRETGDADALLDGCCCSAVDEVGRL
jgi:hypothetical protein